MGVFDAFKKQPLEARKTLQPSGWVTGGLVTQQIIRSISTALVEGTADIIARAVANGIYVDEIAEERFEMFSWQQIYLAVKSMILLGDAYYEDDGTKMYWVDPSLLSYRVNALGNYVYTRNDTGKEVRRERIVHFRNPDIANLSKGLDDTAQAESMLDNAIVGTMVNFYKNWSLPSYILKLPEGSPKAVADELKSLFIETFYQSPNMFYFTNIDIEPVKLEHTIPVQESMDAYRYVAQRLSAISGVPLHRYGLEKYDDNAERMFYHEVIIPLQNYVVYILSPRVDVAVKPIIRGFSVINELVDAVKNGIITINEARRVLGLSEAEKGDELLLITPKGVEDVIDTDETQS